MNVDAALTFLEFVTARHRAYEARQAGRSQPWTDDPIVNTRKFTNVFRVLDYGSQFVLTDLWEPDLPLRSFLLRCFLYRHTGRVDAWEYLAIVGSGYPYTANDLFEVREVWSEYRARGNPLFTNAYLVYPQSSTPGTDKLASIIDLTSHLATNGAFQDFIAANTQQERFNALRRNKGVADFMSMQVLTDFGYATEFRENLFVAPGPGARKGAAALGFRDAHAAVMWAWENIQHLKIGNRSPSWMDAQNTLCEFSKYVRFATKPLPKKPYQPAHPGPQPEPVLPAHW